MLTAQRRPASGHRIFEAGRVKRDGIIPGRMQSVVEVMHDFIMNQTVLPVMGDSGRKFFPFVFSLFIFIFFTNFLGLVPYSFTVTSHIIVTFVLALLVASSMESRTTHR
jgi:F-type H+-transporting ATPase subunit a